MYPAGKIELPTRPRILVVRLSAIGDCVHGLPVVCAIRQALPSARIGWIVEGRTADLLRAHQGIDDVLAIRRGWYRSPKQIWQVRELVRQFRPDVTLDLQGLSKSAFVAWLSGARHRIGFSGAEGREISPWLNRSLVQATSTHIIDKNLELLRPLGINRPSVEFGLPHDQSIAQQVARRLRNSTNHGQLLHTQQGGAEISRFALINPGAGWASKRWPRERFAAVARKLGEQFGLPSVVAWAPGEEAAWAEEIVRLAAPWAVLAPPTSLLEFVELARMSKLLISGDTGPLHLAAAVGTPCVALFGPSDGQRNGPYGSQHVTLQKVRLEGSSSQRRAANDAAISAISVADVLAGCQQLLLCKSKSGPGNQAAA